MDCQNLVVMDVETGGLSNVKNPITQIGMLALNGETYKEIAKYDVFVKPYAGLEILDKALESSRVSMADVKRGIDIREAVKELDGILAKLNIKNRKSHNNKPILIGHNIAFDIGFLSKAFSLFQKDFMDRFYPIPFDTLMLMKRAEAGSKLDAGIRYNLTACCERCEIKLLNAHGAMDDVYATAELFKALNNNLSKSSTGMHVTGFKEEKKEKGRKYFEFYED